MALPLRGDRNGTERYLPESFQKVTPISSWLRRSSGCSAPGHRCGGKQTPHVAVVKRLVVIRRHPPAREFASPSGARR